MDHDRRLAVSRHAAALFCQRGMAATSGDDLAAAAGLSTRTIWRYFRSKEGAVEPLLASCALRFMTLLRRWPLEASLEDFLTGELTTHPAAAQAVADDLQAMRIIRMTEDEPALRATWLMVCATAEDAFAPIIARRVNRPTTEVTVRMTAAAATAAVRVVTEQISVAVLAEARRFGVDDVVAALCPAVRASSHEPFCDPAPYRA
ncbi:TetR/AcrR family transcriptional regulator [Virgisporangium aliadipatigenens]|uniref:TetR/AcrR family transcriptional regulator n=1 Tax=Virgisporangium aliadipatigenens TaxID=741659 RepID=UPI001945A23C|nr:TetR/AcrR family transcriptional regulator [Virgisporangium aliadipatigenens]